MKKLSVLFVLLIISSAYSQDKNLDIKIKYKLTRSESFIVDDKPGHVLSSAEGSGIAEVNSETVQLKSTFNSDYIKGSGDFLVYYVLTAQDNSMLTLKGTGKTSNNGASYSFDGKVSIESGTGRFEAYKGSGTLSGSRKAVIEKGSEVEINISLKPD